MPARRLQSITRAFRYLLGWRILVLSVSPIPLIVVLVAMEQGWGTSLLLAATAMIPVFMVVLVMAVDTTRFAGYFDRIIGPSRRIHTDLQSLAQRLDIIDAVLSSQIRRPWEPTTLPFHFVTGTEPKPALLLPGADYHLPEIMTLAEELDSRGVPNVVAVGIPHWERTGDGLIWYDRDVFEAPAAQDIPGNFSALVTMKDWAGYGPLVEAANDVGIPTFAKVEGAQDFHDVDTNQPRRPYRTAQHILCQGQNDYDALEGMKRTIVGSTRLERLWWAPPANPASDLALINLNFTYGVLTEARDLWLETAVAGCEAAGIPYVISVHPAERARHPHPRATSISASRLLRHATVLISRFSTLPFEAMARGVPFIYHNPHAERVSLYAKPQEAFPTTGDSRQLRSALCSRPEVGTEFRSTAEPFLRRQVTIELDSTCESRTARVLAATLNAR
jgi:hypothetical protein